MKTVCALMIKHSKDSLRNLPSLMILMIYPAVAFVMVTAMKGEENMDEFFVPMFAAMHCSFAPLVLSSNMLSEEKEKGTLRSLIMAGVGRAKYLISLALFVLASVMLTGGAFLLMKPDGASHAASFAAAMLLGSTVSALIGLCVGICSKNVSAANGLAVPVGLIFALIPMLGQFNDTIAVIAKYTYSGQLQTVLESSGISVNAIGVNLAYIAALAVLLLVLFKRRGLE